MEKNNKNKEAVGIKPFFLSLPTDYLIADVCSRRVKSEKGGARGWIMVANKTQVSEEEKRHFVWNVFGLK